MKRRKQRNLRKLRMLRTLAVLALLVALMPCAVRAELGQEVLLPDEGELQADAEVRHAVVKSLFMAAAGTDFESEAKLIEELKAQEEHMAKLQSSPPPEETSAAETEGASESEGSPESGAAEEEPRTLREERRAYLAQYRADTLPWLLKAFEAEEEAEEEAAAESETETGEAAEATQNPAGTVPADETAGRKSADATENPTEEPVWTPETAWTCFTQTDTGRNYLALLESLGAEEAESGLEVTQEICRAWLEEVDHEKMAEINGDYACWLYCADTQIDYPVVHGEDNSYYLNRLFNGAKNAGGTLFIDYRNLEKFQDPNTLIYGHHMRNDSMFGILTEYEKPGFYESHPYVLLLSAEEIAIIEIFAGYTTTEKDHCYDIAISGEEDMAAFVQEAEEKSDFETEVEVCTHDRLTTLSTCAYSFRNARYIIIGRLSPIRKAGAYD